MLTKVIEQAKIDRFARWMGHAERIVIVAHVAPDGDAIGSSLGLWHFLNSQDKTVNVIVPNVFPDFLRWMPGSKDVLLYDHYKEFADKLISEAEIICCLDFNALSRIDAMSDAVKAAKGKKILIDHHLYPEEFCDITISHPNISSTSELVFRLICRMGYFNEITKAGAECIYTGMMTDTGGFTYNSTNPDIYYIICQLLTKGIDKDKIYRSVFNNARVSAVRFRGHLMNEKLQVIESLHASYYTVTRKEMKEYDFIKGDLEGLVNVPLTIRGHKLSISLREDTDIDNRVLVSLRSVDDFPCNKMAEQFFNGGGHRNASGGKLLCSIEEAEKIAQKAILAFADLLR